MKRRGREFWKLTYREIFACIDRYLEERDETNQRFGLLAATIANCAGLTNSHVYTAADFFVLREKPVSFAPASQRLEEFRTASAIIQKQLGQK